MRLRTACKYISSHISYILFLALMLVLAIGVNAQPVTVSNSNGTNGNYPTLADAFNAINSTSQSGTAILVTITGNTSEPASGAVLNAGNWSSLNLYPTGSFSVSGDAGTALIHLNGADHVTIDGRINQTGDPVLQFINNNTGTAASTLLFSNSAQSNIVRFCTFSGGSANSGGGIVCFAGSSASPGNDGNTITNNTISGLSSSLRPVNAIYSQATTAIDNSGNLISNNNIFNFLNPGLASNGIFLSSGSASWTISGNSLYETGSLSPSANVEYAVIRINNTAGNGFVVENNFIGGNSPSGSGMWLKTGSADNRFYGIYMGVGNTSNSNSVQGNSLVHIDWTNSLNANWTGIHVEAGLVNIGTTSGNIIGSGEGIDNIRVTFGTSSTTTIPSGVFGINYASAVAGTIQNNTIGAITTGNLNPAFSCNFFGIAKIANFTLSPLIISNNLIGSLSQNPSITAGSLSQDSVQVVHGIYYNIRNVNLGFVTIANNTISGLANQTNYLTPNDAAPGGQVHGIHTWLFSNTITGNTISNLTASGRNTGSGLFASVIGIMSRFSNANQQISGNTIFNLSNTSAARAKAIGIYYHGSQNLNNRISENFIHSLSVASNSSGAPFGEVYGIRVNYGAATYSNNIINLGADVSSSSYIYGMYEPGTTGNNCNLYHNTIYITGVSNQAGCNSYAFFSGNNQNQKNIRNNIFHNERTFTGGSTYHCAIHFQLNSNGVLSDDYNNYYISPTGYTARIGPPTPITVIGTLSDWQTYFGQDAHSNNENSGFVNGSGQFNIPGDFVPGNPNNGTSGTGITTDFNGTARNCTFTLGAFELGLPVETPSGITVSTGTEPTCQTTGTEVTTYSTTAVNNTGFNWSLSNALAGNINPTTGEMAWASGFSGSVNIQVTANGCNGPSSLVTRTVSITPAVGTPSAINIFSGTEPTCQTSGTEITAYSTFATNSTGFNWSLSNALAGNINPNTGEMAWASGFSGSVDIQVTASGCNGNSAMVTRTVSITPAVGNPSAINIFSGTEPTCQTAGTEITTYSTIATNSSGFNWSLSNALAGNINPETGVMAWASGFSGSVDIQVTASGCNGNSAIVTRTVSITPAVGNPSAINIFSGTEPNCQTSGTEITTYSTTAANSTGFNWSVSNALAGNINPASGVMSWATGFSGNVDIRVTANGCNGNSAMVTRTVSITPAAGTPSDITVFSGTEPACQTTGTEITNYSTTASNSTGFNWSVSNALAGNINPSTGVILWAAGFSGNVDIRVTANGCNGPSAMVVRQVIIHANPEPVILSDANNICEGTSGHIYTTETQMSGYTWSLSTGGTIESGAGTNVLTVTWNTPGDRYVSVSYTNANGCTNTIPAIYPVTVNPILTAGITIGASANPANEGSPVTFTATPVNGGNHPSYQWKVNGLNTGTGDAVFTYIPANGDLVSCELTSDANCITGNPAVSNQVEMTTLSVRTLNIHLLLESLYNGGGTMRQAQGESGPQFPSGIADKVSIELRNPANGAIVYSLSDVSLTTTGNLTGNIPAVHSGSYYIYVKHRNSIATASAAPVSFTGGSVDYDFSTSASKAYGSNLLNLEGFYVIYGGDVNQDETIDTGDMTPVDNDSANYITGYVNTDANGDGVVDTGDISIIDNNAAIFISASLPF